MDTKGEAIYSSSPVLPYMERKVCFTQLKDNTVYAIYLSDENENSLPEKLSLAKFCLAPQADIEILETKTKLKWEGCEIYLAGSITPNKYACTLMISNTAGKYQHK
jgi:hypothetical protein